MAQARALGLVLRTRTGADEPFLAGNVVLWRTGRYAQCQDATGQRNVVFGAEWVLGFLLKEGSEPPKTTTELLSALQHERVLQFGWLVSGAEEDVNLQRQLRALAQGFAQGDTVLLRRSIEAFAAAWPAERFPARPIVALGIAQP